MDKITYSLMASYIIIMAVLIHLPRAKGHELGTENRTADLAKEKVLEMTNFFHNILIT